MKKIVFLFLVGSVVFGGSSLIATDDNEISIEVFDEHTAEPSPVEPSLVEPSLVEPEPVEEIEIFEANLVEINPVEPQPVEPKPVEEVQDNIKHALFTALKAYGFDEEFLKGKEVVIVEKDEDGKYVPRYVSHEYKHNPFFMFDNGVMAGVSIIAFVLTTPLFYKVFHSSTYKEVLGDMFSLVSAVTSGGCVAYLSGKLASEIYKHSSEQKLNNK